MNSRDEIADPILYRTYFSLMMGDILHKLGVSPTLKNKERLHEFHKRILEVKSTAGMTHEQMSKFLFDVCVYWVTERGFFIRTNRYQPYDIEDRPLSTVWHLL